MDLMEWTDAMCTLAHTVVQALTHSSGQSHLEVARTTITPPPTRKRFTELAWRFSSRDSREAFQTTTTCVSGDKLSKCDVICRSWDAQNRCAASSLPSTTNSRFTSDFNGRSKASLTFWMGMKSKLYHAQCRN